jgi:hypothetical protein
MSRPDTASQNFFIISVDRIFTTSIEAAFTNAFDRCAAREATACLCRARHGD